MLKSSPVRVVPPARVDFTAEDRQWIADRIQEVLASGRLTLGTYGEEFERRFADYLGAKHAVAVNCGTSALEIIFRALGVEGRDVLVPANTNYVTVVAVVHAGGRPVLMGTEAETLGTAPEEVERCITPNTRGSHGCFRTRRLSPLCGSFFPKGNGAPREGVRGHNTSLIKTG